MLTQWKFVSVPIAYSVSVKERYDNLKMILGKIKYIEHECVVCGNHTWPSYLDNNHGIQKCRALSANG